MEATQKFQFQPETMSYTGDVGLLLALGCCAVCYEGLKYMGQKKGGKKRKYSRLTFTNERSGISRDCLIVCLYFFWMSRFKIEISAHERAK